MNITTFVVGAGASREFGLFANKSLSETVIENMTIPSDRGSWFRDNPIGEHVRNLPNPHSLIDAAKRLQDGLISSPSIDDFLHNHGDDQALVQMGKLAIARCIVEAENHSLIGPGARPLAWVVDDDDGMNPPVRDDLKAADVMRALRKTWLGELFTLLTPGVSKSKVDTIFDGIRFICFNYDRCIETFLFYALQSHYGISAAQAGEIIAKLQIVHPYGMIGDLGFVSGTNSPVAYGQKLQHVNLIEMASTIRTYNEQIDGCCDQAEITRLIQEATNIVFLGFAFHKQNMALLRKPFASNHGSYGTAYLEKGSRSEVFRQRASAVGISPPSLQPIDCATFIHNFGLEIID